MIRYRKITLGGSHEIYNTATVQSLFRMPSKLPCHGNASLRIYAIQLDKEDCEEMTKEQLRGLVEGLTDDDLRTLRAIINGKISKRKIDPTQQAAMQAARKRKVI